MGVLWRQRLRMEMGWVKVEAAFFEEIGALSPQQQQEIPRVMEIVKNSDWKSCRRKGDFVPGNCSLFRRHLARCVGFRTIFPPFCSGTG